MLDMEKEILFETKRLIVREILEQDAEKLAEMASDGSWQEVGLDAECRSWIKDWIWEAQALSKTNDPRKDYLAYVCVLKESMEVIGLVGCSYYQDLKEVGITYCVGSAYRNKGYAQEAAKAYTEYVFAHYEVPKLIATIKEDNISSWKVAQKAGFELEMIKWYQDINDEKEELYRFYVLKGTAEDE